MLSALFEHPLTPKQQEVLDYRGDHLLIKGIAGSGKTTVLLRKAKKIVEEEHGSTIAVFTYNTTLASYAEMLAKMISPNRIKVFTFHSWAFQQLRTMRVRVSPVDDREKQHLIIQAAAAVAQGKQNRLLDMRKYLEFMEDEISWIKGKGMTTLPEYLNSPRTGRGGKVRVLEIDKAAIFEVYVMYQQLLRAARKNDYDDFALMILNDLGNFPLSGQYDHIFIDEAQDLQQTQLNLLRIAARKSLFIAADKGQKIYKTSFAWKDVGINILGGRTKILQNTFRSTKQIISLAHSLQKHDPVCRNRDEDYVEPVYPDIEGATPQMLVCSGELEEKRVINRLASSIYKANPEYTVGILCRFWSDIRDIKYSLEEYGLKPEIIQKDKGNCHAPGIKLTTFHSAKGLEFDAVIIARFNDGIVPFIEEDTQEIEEHIAVERRLLYVSLTRAKKQLYMVCSGAQSTFAKEFDASLFNMVKA
ncbi:ATP-dependent helicase [Paenibacillus sp. GD4]|uniref:3'-5' exonuclease n=1 Tax=Paenibacillus sp. GD4 TaxID=3068890 RepID=UPI002796A41D|nr:ATP-dependent helicase [Paenibacillus sp. GD4]MDQ1910532.1 ATP-dependent helicase [Paenibacillus sp. GD4]